MNLTADQQAMLLSEMATKAAAAGVPQDKIEAKLKELGARISNGENVFAPVFERAKELSAARKTFNMKDRDPWVPEYQEQSNAVRNSPSRGVPAAVAAEREANKYREDSGSGIVGFEEASKSAISAAGRTLLGAAVGAQQVLDPIGTSVKDALNIPNKERELAFQTIDALREQEQKRSPKGAGGIVGNLLGGFATLGLGGLSSGQDVIKEGGTLGEAVAAQAVDTAVAEAGLAAGMLLPGASVAARMGAQGAASAAAGAGGRSVKNEFVPERLKQDALDPMALALDFGAGAIGGIVPNRPRASVRTGDAATDAGIAATEKIMGKSVDTTKKVFDIDPAKQYTEQFSVPRKDFSTTPREEVDAEAFLNEPRKQDQITKAYRQLRAERRATEELAYAQKSAQDAAIYQELPGIEPTEPVRGATQQDVPRGRNLNLDQLSVLRDQLRQQQAPIEQPSGPQQFDTEFMSDPRNPTPDVSVTQLPDPTFKDGPIDLSRVKAATDFMSKKASKNITYGKPSWEWDPKSSELTVRESRLPKKVKVVEDADLQQKLKSVEDAMLFSRFNYAKDAEVPALGPDRFKENPFIATNEQRARLKGLGDAVRSAGNAYNVADMIVGTAKSSKERVPTAELFQKFKENPVTADLLKKLKVTVYNPEDLASVTNANLQKLGPDSRGGMTFGGWSPTTGVSVIGEGFAKSASGDHGLTPTNLAHEIVHGLTSEVILGVENLNIIDSKIGRAVDEAKQYMEIAGTQLSKLKNLDKEVTGWMQYGQTNLHEFLAVAASDPRVQTVMKSVRVGEDTLWKKFVGSVRRILGLSPVYDNLLDRVMDVTYRIGTWESVGQKAKRERMESQSRASSQQAAQPQEAGVPGFVKTALVGDGRFPRIRQAKEIASGEKALGATEAEQMANRYNKATKNFTPDQIKALDADMKIAVENSSKPEGREAITRLEQLSPAVGGIVREFAKGRRAEAVAMARSFADNPNATDMQKAIAYKVLQQADSYLTRAYAINSTPGLGKLKLKLAKRAEEKIAKGQTPFAREQAALDQRNGLKSYLMDRFFNDDLESVRSQELEGIYTYFTGRHVEDIRPLDSFEGDNPKALRKAFMIGEIRAARDKTNSIDTAVDQLVDVVARVNNTAPVARYFKNLREGSDVASTLKDVPEPIRKFWGEVEKPIARMMATVRNQASINSQLNALASLRKEGMGTLFQEGKGHEGYTETLAGEKMGPLQGLNTTPEVKAALESFVQTGSFLGSWDQVLSGDPTGRGALAKLAVNTFDVIKAGTSVRKSMSVLGNFVGSILRNGYGSGLQALANGNLNLMHWSEGMGDMLNLINLSGRQSTSPGAKRAIRLKLAEATQLEDTYSAGAKRVFQKMMDEGGFTTPDTFFQKAHEAIKELGYKGQTGVRIAKEIYGAADLWSKLANYRYELDFWSEYNKKHGGIEDVEKFVADRINNTNITPGRASPVAKVSDYVGASTFLPYTMEVGRSLYNNMHYGFQDMLDGAKLGRTELITHGAKRVIGAASAVTGGTWALSSVLKVMGALSGIVAEEIGDDTDRKKYLQSGDFTAGSSMLSTKDSSGKEYTLDVGMMNPYDPVARPINKLIEALGESDPKKKEAKIKEAQKAATGLLHQNSVWGLLMKAYEGQEPSVAKSNPKFYQDSLQFAVNTLGLSKKQADAAINAGMIVAPKGGLEAYKGLNEETDPAIKGLIASGIGVNRFDAAKDIANYEGQAFNAELSKAKRGYTDLLKLDFDVDPKRVEQDFVSAIKDLAEPYQKLQLAVNAAKEQGKTTEQIVRAMKLGRVNNKAIGPILEGKSPPIALVISSLQQDLRDDVYKEGGDKAVERARRNSAILRNLVLKYKDVTVSDLTNNGVSDNGQ